MEETKDIYQNIRPLLDSEVNETIVQLIQDTSFRKAVEPIVKPFTWEQFTSFLLQCNSKYDFQKGVIYPIMTRLIKNTTTEMIGMGWDDIPKNESHIYISNHRDIVLDAAFFNMLLFDQQMQTTEIAIGDNLLVYHWIEKLVRLNKSFIVKRGVSVREMLKVSKHLSNYIHHTITDKNQSIWLAQREGRAKDSNDKTQTSLLKMLTLHQSSHPLQALKQLNIVPLSISYEYDPCDFLKAKEFQQKRDNPNHKKNKADDIENMYTGMTGFKGRVHFKFGNRINPLLDEIEADTGRNEILKIAANIIDNEIYRNYSFFPVNYIAYDMMTKSRKFNSKYSNKEKEEFNTYINLQIDKVNLPQKDIEYLKNQIIAMYGNTVKNKLTITENI